MDVFAIDCYKANKEQNRKYDFGYFAELNSASDSDALKNSLHEIVTRLGFTDYSIINIDCANSPQAELNTLPPALMQNYFDRRLYSDDMILQRAVNYSDPFLSSMVHEHVNCAPYKSSMTRNMAAIYELSKSFGYYDYFNIPYKMPFANIMLSVGCRGASPLDFKALVKESAQSLVLFADAIAYALTNKFDDLLPLRNEEASINPKPLRVLSLLANSDLTIEQVAHELCISVVTANQHLKTCRSKLGVKTNYASIKQCILGGTIKYDEAPRDAGG